MAKLAPAMARGSGFDPVTASELALVVADPLFPLIPEADD
jgi:hypothetical protein